MMGMTCLVASEMPIYSLSVELSAISVCNLDTQHNGMPAYVMMYPYLDLAALLSSSGAPLYHAPAKSASTYTLNPSYGLGV